MVKMEIIPNFTLQIPRQGSPLTVRRAFVRPCFINKRVFESWALLGFGVLQGVLHFLIAK